MHPNRICKVIGLKGRKYRRRIGADAGYGESPLYFVAFSLITEFP